MYKKILVFVISFFSFFISYTALDDINLVHYKRYNNNKILRVYESQKVTNSIIKTPVYTWLHNQKPQKPQEVFMNNNFDNITLVHEIPNTSYKKSIDGQDILATYRICQCCAVGIKSSLNNSLKRYLFHFNFSFPQEVLKNKELLKKILNKLQYKDRYDIVVSSSYYSPQVFDILSIIKGTHCCITYLDIDPLYCYEIFAMHRTNILNFFVLDTEFRGLINTPKNIALLPEGNIVNTPISNNNLNELSIRLFKSLGISPENYLKNSEVN